MKVPHMAIPIVFSFQPFPMGLVWIFSVCSLEFKLATSGTAAFRGLVSAFSLPSCHQRNWKGSEVGLLTEGRNSSIHQKRLKIWEDDFFSSFTPSSLFSFASAVPSPFSSPFLLSFPPDWLFLSVPRLSLPSLLSLISQWSCKNSMPEAGKDQTQPFSY